MISRLQVVLCCGLLSMAGSLRAAGRVEMELSIDPKGGLSQQQWLGVLTQLKVTGLQMRTTRASDSVGMQVRGTPESPVYKVSGLINDRSELIVPGGRFSLSNTSALAAWLKRLSEDGPPSPATPFGLDEATIRRVHAQLRGTVDFATREMSTPDAVSRISRKLPLPLVQEPGTDAALRTAGKVRDELEGLSAGTALAALVRPAGLAVAPRKNRQGNIELVIRKAAAGDVWPVGLSAEDKRKELLPALFESINVEVDNNLLVDAVKAVCERLEIPFLVDHNSLAVQGVDFQKAVVSLPPSKLSYSLILRRLLGQSALIGELRTDEAGKPFLWITTLGRG